MPTGDGSGPGVFEIRALWGGGASGARMRLACPLLPGLLSAPLEKYAVRALALALEHVQVGERGGVEIRRGDRVLGDLAGVHCEDGKVTDRHDRRLNACDGSGPGVGSLTGTQESIA